MRKNLTSLFVLPALAALALVGQASPARADIIVSLNNTTYATVTGTAGDPTTTNGANYDPTAFTYDGLSFKGFSVTGDQYPVTESQSASVQITNSTSAAITLSLDIVISGFSSPTAPPTADVTSYLSGTYTTTEGSSADALGVTSSVYDGKGDSTGVLTPSVPSLPANGAFSTGDAYGQLTTLDAPFSIEQTITLTLAAGAQLQFTDTTTVVTTPVPSGVVLVLSGIPALGLVYWFRRRQVSLAAV